MKPLPPLLADTLSRVAHTVGDLWAITAQLSSFPASPDFDAEGWFAAIRRAAVDLAPVGERLALLAAALPVPAEMAADVDLSPLELARAGVECVLADHLYPAVADLTALGTGPASRRPFAEASLECVLADRLHPAIGALTRLLLLGEIPAHATTSRPS
jgi:hypothetical protein